MEELTSRFLKKQAYRKDIEDKSLELSRTNLELQELPMWRFFYMVILHRKCKKIIADIGELTKKMREL